MAFANVEEEYKKLAESLGGFVLLPHDPAYDGARQVWNCHHDRKPALIVRPSGAHDVAAAVRFAKEHGLGVSVKSGGHHVSGLGACDGQLMIDMSLMRGVSVNPESRTAVVQGGARAIDVIRETQLFGLALPTGNVGRVGVAALALGGGFGFMRRRHGLTCDFLLGADLVLADGSVRHVDAEHHPDLFWAIRGGGGNFGVAATLYFRLVPVGPMVAGIHTIYGAEDAKAVLTGCRDYLAQAGNEVSLNIDVASVPPAPEVPPPFRGRTIIMVNGMHSGANLTEALEAVEPLRHLAEPIMDMTGLMSYQALHTILDQMVPEANMVHVESLYANAFSDAVIEKIAGLAAEARPGQAVMLWPLGGKMADSSDDMAFGDRSAGLVIMLEAGWMDRSDAVHGIQWVQQSRTALSEFAHNGSTYLNVTDFAYDPVGLLKHAYGPKYDRLKALKKQYDPDNMFRFNANIDPAID